MTTYVHLQNPVPILISFDKMQRLTHISCLSNAGRLVREDQVGRVPLQPVAHLGAHLRGGQGTHLPSSLFALST